MILDWLRIHLNTHNVGWTTMSGNLLLIWTAPNIPTSVRWALSFLSTLNWLSMPPTVAGK